MHSYQHHIKDFNNATRHLTRVERSLYRDAIELYYETEQPLPADDFDRLARRLMAVTDEEKTALKMVLDEFFDLTGNVYSHDRCDEEIEKFHNAQTAKSVAGKASAEARRKRQEARKESRKKQNLTDVEQPLNSVDTEDQQNATNHKPITKNQEPLNTVKTHTDYTTLHHDVDENNSQIISVDQNPIESESPPGKQTPAAVVCISIKKHGIVDVNPAHPELLELIRIGATVDEFMHAARTAKDRQKGFAYVLGIVKKQRENVKAMSGKLHEGSLPNKQESLEQRNFAVAESWVPPELRNKEKA
ncbi:MAG: YdaU family protein [Burkholderiales bacterium]|nr:YdaU family protein [Burkholderiales bacterium]